MNRIRLLPEHVANQIAAGEVVERPASVVKELVENALDAQCTRLTVEVQAGGRSLIRVTDDGIGMSRDDALLCLERHATSKIQRAEDLHGIATMGFRGEALPSIASVSRFTLTTRERDSDSPEGTQVIINGGKITEVKAAGSAPGTCIEARSLFFNLPARRKFLRSEETESAHIQHYLTLAALAYPEVSFTFIKDARPVWQVPGIKGAQTPETRMAALRERMRQLAGTLPELIPLDCAGPLHEHVSGDREVAPGQFSSQIRIWGLMGAPGVSRGTRENQHIFINRRPVENRTLNHALIEGYHTALMKGRYPVCCLFVEIDPAAVDVNIHPAKREVKFRDDRAVRGFVTNAVRNALLQYHKAEVGGDGEVGGVRGEVRAGNGEGRGTVEGQVSSASGVMPGTSQTADTNQAPALPGFAPPVSKPLPVATSPLPLSFRREEDAPAIAPLPNTQPAQIAVLPKPAVQISQAVPPAEVGRAPGPTPLLAVPLRIVGVIGRLYVVLESDRGLVLLDQHAAHERILYEQMVERLERGEVASQRLLLPETLELSPRDASFVRGLLGTFTRLGVSISEFGERTFLLDALPSIVKSTEPRAFVLGVIDELKAAGEGVNSMRLGEHVIAKTVCRHAIKANDPLTGPELENLLADLRRCAMPYTCPHGRPTLIEMSFRELEKKFGRSQ